MNRGPAAGTYACGERSELTVATETEAHAAARAAEEPDAADVARPDPATLRLSPPSCGAPRARPCASPWPSPPTRPWPRTSSRKPTSPSTPTCAAPIRASTAARPFLPWLLGAVAHRALSARRAGGRRALREWQLDPRRWLGGERSLPAPPQEASDPGPADPLETVLRDEGVREVWAAVDRLPPKLRQVAVLRYAGDLPLADIATAVGVPEGTVKSRLAAAAPSPPPSPPCATSRRASPGLGACPSRPAEPADAPRRPQDVSQTLLRTRTSPPPGGAAPGVSPALRAATPEGKLDHRLTRLRDRLDTATAGVDLAPRLLAALDAGARRPAARARRPGGPAIGRALRLLLLGAVAALALTAGAGGAAPLLRDRVLVPALEQVTPAARSLRGPG